MSSPAAISHLPAPLHLPDFDDDDDVFDDKDDNLTGPLPYVFSPDAIREEMARNIPEMEESWAEADSVSSVAESSSDQNASVSTLNIDPDAPTEDNPLESSLSAHFSRISLTTPSEERPSQSFSNSDDESPPNSNYTSHDDSLDTPIHPPQDTPTTPPRSPQENERSSSESYPSGLTPPTSAPLPRLHLSEDSPPTSASLSTSHSASSFSLPPIPPVSVVQQSNGLLTEAPRSHKPRRSLGPSAFEKVRSKTRPVFLPPKPKSEDAKHLADWQEMMKQSRLTAEKRRKAFQERRLARERAIEENLHIWEHDILPDWRVVHKNPQLRKLWWHGIPTKLRAPLWEKAVGNELALSKDHYRTCLSRAKRALTSGVFPQATLDVIEEDISTTLPAVHIFNKENGPLYPDLKDMLCAWVVSRSDEGLGYTVGAAKIAAMLLINMPCQQAFVVMRNLLERHCEYGDGSYVAPEAHPSPRIFDTLLADGMPKIYFNFKQHQVSPGAYLPDWVISLFLDHLPFEACARIWDVLMLEGDSFLYRASLGILAVLEPRLFFPDKKELLELLKCDILCIAFNTKLTNKSNRGENKAAIEVAKREGRSLIGGKYEIYGVDEETLWDRIDSMDDWWKESTWTRLIQRELPDI
ncbi:hypothetical protein CVT25_015583 [Psilocybe cyanescens]|uniref:Rab-GAP TBC domain-containing protein n=1 Tax=Psilocybe cyanescens TaxID=93625 RepID=A0A409WHM0_PSICY|nr:hypothetical protein CVT25_015583 [Psilocybe cyanescens]